MSWARAGSHLCILLLDVWLCGLTILSCTGEDEMSGDGGGQQGRRSQASGGPSGLSRRPPDRHFRETETNF